MFAAQMTLRLATAAVQLTLVVGVGMLFFDLEVVGSWATLVAFGFLGAVMFIALGYALAGVVPSQGSGLAIVLLLNFAMLFLGQIFFDLSDIEWLNRVSMAFPVTYLADAFRHVVTGIESEYQLWLNSLVLCLWALGAGVLAIRSFRLEGGQT